MAPITAASGRAIPLRGNELDTDRIMPARFLKAVTFDGLEKHVFEDDRKDNPTHPFNNAKYHGAAVLVVNENFGCGSSREHAPQGLIRYGIKAIVGESYSEIFLGNSSVLGLPCFTADKASIEALQSLIERAGDRRRCASGHRRHHCRFVDSPGKPAHWRSRRVSHRQMEPDLDAAGQLRAGQEHGVARAVRRGVLDTSGYGLRTIDSATPTVTLREARVHRGFRLWAPGCRQRHEVTFREARSNRCLPFLISQIPEAARPRSVRERSQNSPLHPCRPC